MITRIHRTPRASHHTLSLIKIQCFSNPTLIRHFHRTKPVYINPLLPIDGILEEINADESSKNVEKLEKKIRGNHRKPKNLIPTHADHFKTLDKEDGTEQLASGSSGGGNGNNSRRKKNDDDDDNGKYKQHEYSDEPKETPYSKFKKFAVKCIETASITFSTLLVLGLAGLSYHRLYSNHVISKMSESFDKGSTDSSFELTMHSRVTSREGDWIDRPQQKILDDIMSGALIGRYFLLSGEKGSGKNSMVLNAMKKVNGFNCGFIDAHSDPEIFRIRLGKCLNYEFNEDYFGSLFSMRGPRDGSALLDIERAFNKLEEVAVERVKKYGKPLVLVINNVHLIKDEDSYPGTDKVNGEGCKLVELLQQKAEALSGAGLVTIVFIADDYWFYERLKKLSTRLEVLNFRDFTRQESLKSLEISRLRFFNEKIDKEVANQVYDLIGGRPQHLSEVSKQPDLIKACHQLIDREKTWFLNQCGLLGSTMDDDVNESGKFSTSAMLLMKEFVDMFFEQQKSSNHLSTSSQDHQLPELPLWRARQIMTRNDYIQAYDNLNIFTIDSSNSFVRADSVPMMRGFSEIASMPGFTELLNDTLDRVGEIESLGRTREIVAKDLVLGSKYKISKDQDGSFIVRASMNQDDEDEDGLPIEIQPVTKSGGRKYWEKRLNTNDRD